MPNTSQPTAPAQPSTPQKTVTTTQSNVASLNHPWQKELREFLLEVQNDPRFVFLGYITDIELLQIYKQARANILVSRDEGFGYSFVESALMGTPSVLANIPIFKETAKDDALFADPSNPQDIAQKIAALSFDAALRERLSIKAFERAQDFKSDNFKKAWGQVLGIQV